MWETKEISAQGMPKPTMAIATLKPLQNFEKRNSAHRNEVCLLNILPGSESSSMNAMSTCCDIGRVDYESTIVFTVIMI